MPTMARLVTIDCEEFNAWSKILGWDAEYRQLGRGKLDAWFEPTLCADLWIGHGCCNRSLSISGTPPHDNVPLLLPMNTAKGSIFQGKPLAENDAVIICPDSEALYRYPVDQHLMAVSFPLARLLKAIESSNAGDAESFISNTRALSMPDTLVHELKHDIQWLIRLASASPAGGLSDVSLHEAEEQLISTFVAGLTFATDDNSESLAARNRLRYVKRAQDYIEAHLDTPLGLETLSLVTGVSQRTLRYAFEQVLGVSPKRYVNSRRLYACRRALLGECSDDATVTRVASRFGFSHLGYFARDYRALFGENPSQTLGMKS